MVRLGVAFVVAVAAPGAAHGQDCWAPGSLFPRTDAPATATFAIQATSGWSAGYVPHFRAGERDRGTAGVDAMVELAPFEIRAQWDWIADVTPAAGLTTGPGDLRLGTVVTPWRARGFDVTLGWEVKLPNASDEGEIGTDETDVRFGATGGWQSGAWRARVGIGLGVLGNPLRFANQDDIPLVRSEVAWERAPFAVIGRASLDVPTPRNPIRADADLALRWGRRWHVLAHGGGGLVPAAPDWHVGFAVGYAGPLPGSRPGA